MAHEVLDFWFDRPNRRHWFEASDAFDLSYPSHEHRMFCYLPFEYSEDIEEQRLSFQLFNERAIEAGYRKYALRLEARGTRVSAVAKLVALPLRMQ